jgi:hypothetical protein
MYLKILNIITQLACWHRSHWLIRKRLKAIKNKFKRYQALEKAMPAYIEHVVQSV